MLKMKQRIQVHDNNKDNKKPDVGEKTSVFIIVIKYIKVKA